MPKRKKSLSRPQKGLDSISANKSGRGRPPKMRPSEVYGRALNYRTIFGQVWDKLGEPLLNTTSEAEVAQSFEAYAPQYAYEFVPLLVRLIFEIVHHPKFPKRREPQINYLADSLAALGWVRPKRSREIVAHEVAKERAKLKHRVVRREFYIECTCGYQGPAYKGKCPRRHPGKAQSEFPDILFQPRIF